MNGIVLSRVRFKRRQFLSTERRPTQAFSKLAIQRTRAVEFQYHSSFCTLLQNYLLLSDKKTFRLEAERTGKTERESNIIYELSSAFSFLIVEKRTTTQNAFSSSPSPLKEKGERSSIAKSDLPMKTKLKTRFPLRREHCESSSWLKVLPLLGNKDGTRTIEMILVSTVLDLKETSVKPSSRPPAYTCGTHQVRMRRT